MSGMLQSMMGLLVVVGAIFALAWALRRLQGLRPKSAAGLQIHAGLSVGARERVLWIEAGGKHLLIGVAQGRVNALHVYDEAPVLESPTTQQGVQAPNFGELLKKALGREGQ
jgi:flagellar protein FliO/FliZ